MFEYLPGLPAILAVIVAGAIQGSTGFGFNMLAAPVLAVISTRYVPGAVVLISTVVCIVGALQERRAVVWSDLGFALTGRFVAACLATLLMGVLSDDAFSLIFGLSVLLAVVLSLFGVPIPKTRATLGIAGTISGFMGTLTSIGAPPMALVYQDSDPAQARPTLNAFFVVGGLLSLAALSLGGHFGRTDILLGLGLLPFSLIGLWLSVVWRGRISRSHVKRIVLIVSSASAAILLWRALT